MGVGVLRREAALNLGPGAAEAGQCAAEEGQGVVALLFQSLRAEEGRFKPPSADPRPLHETFLRFFFLADAACLAAWSALWNRRA